MKIKYFSWIKEITSCDKEILNENNINNIENLKLFLSKKYPDLKKHFDKDILRFAINQEYIANNIVLEKNDEIAIFPPVSGG